MTRGFMDGDESRLNLGNAQKVTLEVELHKETDDAWLVSTDGDERRAKWVPKSQCELIDSELVIPEWLAIKKGLI